MPVDLPACLRRLPPAAGPSSFSNTFPPDLLLCPPAKMCRDCWLRLLEPTDLGSVPGCLTLDV